MFEHYYTPEQLAELKGRSESLGPDGMRQAEADWQELIAAVRDEMDAGADPASERVQALAQRWNALVLAFTGGNPEIERSLQTMYQQEFGSGKPPTGAWQNKIDPRIMEYRAFISKAMEASQKP